MDTKAGLDIAVEGNAAVASFKNACISDVEEITNASAQVKQYIEANQPRKMVFDFDGVKFFSSQVLGLLLEARARLESHSGQVAITSLSPQLQRVFKITNLDKIFHLYPDRAAALAQSPCVHN
ncbi:MAG: STAS domain-containing protein [Planctomycetes bacterium]|nr:STAS domain-containing protein [Planctomycetota bacterium]